MLLKRSTPSFTVEFRQSKRPKPGSSQTSWVSERLAPTALIKEPERIAESAFKLVADHPLMGSPEASLPLRRILPSLVDLESPSTPSLSVDAKPRGAKRRKLGAIGSGEVRQAEARRQTPETKTSTDALGEPAPVSIEAPTPPSKERATHRAPVRTGKTSKPKKQSSRPADWRDKLEGVRSAPASPATTIVPGKSTSDAPPVSDPVANVRKARVLSRYVFRNDLPPGNGWKRRIQAQRDRRGS
jgi:hypothetical protein